MTKENVKHPAHYGGKDNPYETIKVVEAWDLGFCLGNVLKYISRAGKKGEELEDLKKAAWYLNREIESRTQEKPKSETTFMGNPHETGCLCKICYGW